MKPLLALQRTFRAKVQQLPEIIVFLGLHVALGFALGVVFAAALVLTNVAGLKGLLETSDSPYVAMILLFVMCGLTFASLVTGAAVMSMPRGKRRD